MITWGGQVRRALRSYRLWTVLGGFTMTWLAWFSLIGYLPVTIFDTGDRLVHDQRLRWQTPALDPQVLIVDIDERSLVSEGRWTWPRAGSPTPMRTGPDLG